MYIWRLRGRAGRCAGREVLETGEGWRRGCGIGMLFVGREKGEEMDLWDLLPQNNERGKKEKKEKRGK